MSWIATKGRTGTALHMAVNGKITNGIKEILEILRKIIEIFTSLNRIINIRSNLVEEKYAR